MIMIETQCSDTALLLLVNPCIPFLLCGLPHALLRPYYDPLMWFMILGWNYRVLTMRICNNMLVLVVRMLKEFSHNYRLHISLFEHSCWLFCWSMPILLSTQDDVAMGTLTVRENIAFSAALRLPSKYTRRERRQKVDLVIKELGLTHVADSKVSDVR